MVAIVDYGVGNLQSVYNGFKHINDNVIVTNDKSKITDATHIVLPGVGAFKAGMDNLEKKGFIDLIYSEIKKGKPFLGICLGMQLLMSKSFEMGEYKGLNLIEGSVVRFQECGYKIPQIGWNNIKIKQDSLFENVKDESMFYFVHSYYVKPFDNNVIACETEYNNINYCSAIEKDNIFACQFHPEKSGVVGLEVLKNFCEL